MIQTSTAEMTSLGLESEGAQGNVKGWGGFVQQLCLGLVGRWGSELIHSGPGKRSWALGRCSQPGEKLCKWIPAPQGWLCKPMPAPLSFQN